MNSIKIYFKSGDSWSEELGVVFPFRYGELLDERLDEAYVDIIGSTVEAYKPTTEVKVEINNNGTPYSQHYIVANDSSVEYPVGSGKYKHSIYLIERTKLLEGIVCSSLTFTNALPRDYLGEYNYNAPPDFVGVPSKLGIPDRLYYADFGIKQYIDGEASYTPPTLADIKKVILNGNFYQSDINLRAEGFILTNGSSVWSTAEENLSQTVSPENPLTLLYHFSINKETNDSQALRIKFSPIATESHKELKRLTITDCVNRVLECAMPLFGEESPKYRFDGVTYSGGIASREYTGQAAIYEKVLAPEFTMTQCTLREQLKIIGSFIHAEPYLDENDVVKFIPLNTNKKATLSNTRISATAQHNINQYCNDVRSNISSLTSSLHFAKGIKLVEPNDNWYSSLRCETSNSRIEEGNAVVCTAEPIQRIVKLECGVLDPEEKSEWKVLPVDITKYIYEATEYNTHLDSFGKQFPSKSCALYYSIGGKCITGIFYKAPDAVASKRMFAIRNIILAEEDKDVQSVCESQPELLLFRVTYIPQLSIAASHGKGMYINGEQNFTQIYNQSENMVESEYLGENLKGVAARLGNVEEERSYLFSSFDEIPSVGERVDDFSISAVSVEIMPNHIKCTLGLTKDFNRISEYVGVSNLKRLYEISERNVYNRDILIKEYLIVCREKPNALPHTIMHDISGFRALFKHDEASAAVVTPDKGEVDLGDGSSGSAVLSAGSRLTNARIICNTKTKHISSAILPLCSVQLGNVLAHKFSMLDNFSAGQKSVYSEGEEDVKGYWLKDVAYPDYYGKVYWLSFAIGATGVLEAEKVFDFAHEFPDIAHYSFPNRINTADVGRYRLRKDNRERISITYEIEAKSAIEGLSIGSDFMSYCRDVDSREVPKLKLYVFGSEYNGGKFDRDFIKTDEMKEYDFKPEWVSYSDNRSFSITPKDEEGNAIANIGYGWAITTEPSQQEFEVEDEDGNLLNQTIDVGGKILLLSTANDEDPITLEFYVARN